MLILDLWGHPTVVFYIARLKMIFSVLFSQNSSSFFVYLKKEWCYVNSWVPYLNFNRSYEENVLTQINYSNVFDKSW